MVNSSLCQVYIKITMIYLLCLIVIFRSCVMLGRVICTTLNKKKNIPLFQEFSKPTKYILETKLVTFFINVTYIILDLPLMDKINLAVLHITV